MMLRRKEKREVGALNTTATSDISFMLLIFFLVTTSMNTDKGLGRRLPPMVPEELQGQNDVQKDMVLTLHLMPHGQLTLNDKPAKADAALRREVSQFMATKGPGHIIEVQVDRDADYDSYFRLQNQLSRAYNETRQAAARRKYSRPMARLTDDERDAIMKMYPQRIQEVVNY